ncbi:MAG: hypothetical protein SangKO_037560 [Sandaracinaceae bacterium]
MCVLRSQRIPLQGDDSWTWAAFLSKAGKGSAKAFDVVSEAESAFMVPVARDVRAVDWAPARVLPLYAKQIGSAPIVQRLLDVAAEQAWVAERLEADGARARTYRCLWGSPPVRPSLLLLAAAHRCVERWSAQEIASIHEQDPLAFDAAHIVSAMLLMSYAWPESYADRLDT